MVGCLISGRRSCDKWRDEYLFKPPHRWTQEQATGSPLPSARDMHDAGVEVFTGIPHAHVAYRAAIFYRPKPAHVKHEGPAPHPKIFIRTFE